MLKRRRILRKTEQHYTYQSNIRIIHIQILMTICNFYAQYRNSETFENIADTALSLFIKSDTFHFPNTRK